MAHIELTLIGKLKAQICEKCGETENPGIHHVRKLKDLDSKGFFR
ncbi:HNH endonuclease [Porphyromonas macacae]